MKSVIAFAVTVTLMMGCGVKPPIEARLDPYYGKQIHPDSNELRHDVPVGMPRAVRNESGQLVVTIPIRSATNKTIYIDHRVTFFDAAGVPIETQAYQTKVLQPNTPDRIVLTSSSTRAADFQFDYRFAR